MTKKDKKEPIEWVAFADMNDPIYKEIYGTGETEEEAITDLLVKKLKEKKQ